jgi:hypothetical protein
MKAKENRQLVTDGSHTMKQLSLTTAGVRSTEQIVVDNLHALSITLLLIFWLMGGLR